MKEKTKVVQDKENNKIESIIENKKGKSTMYWQQNENELNWGIEVIKYERESS